MEDGEEDESGLKRDRGYCDKGDGVSIPNY